MWTDYSYTYGLNEQGCDGFGHATYSERSDAQSNSHLHPKQATGAFEPRMFLSLHSPLYISQYPPPDLHCAVLHPLPLYALTMRQEATA